MFPVFLPMFIFMPVLQEPTSAFATWLSLIPLFTPMLMIIRTASPVGIPAWQPWVGLVGVLLFTVFIVWIGGRIFRVGILMQGGPPKILRIFFKFNRSLLSKLCVCGKEALIKYLKTTTEKDLTPGIIAVIQSFGSRINFHPHLHFLITA